MIKCINVEAILINFLFVATLTNPSSLYEYSRTVNNKNSQNVGSILFDKNDVKKPCWSNEQLTLLISRKIFQDLLPEVESLDPLSYEFPLLILEYMDICLGIIQEETTGRIRYLMKKALGDTLGGYFHVYILPMTRKSYYAGNLEYEDTRELFDLYNEILDFLHTDGFGWLKPKSDDVLYEGEPIPTGPDPKACSNLVLYSENGTSVLPMPFLDDEKNPASIALPFEKASLYSLFTGSSAFILVKYFKAGYSCLSSSPEKREGVTRGNVNKFKRQLEGWINKAVARHLDDDKWYPAFGGVLRVVNTLKSSETLESEIDYEETDNPIVGAAYPTSTCSPNESNKPKWSKWEYIALAVIFGVLFWVLLGVCIVCCRKKNYTSYYQDGTPVAVVYKNTNCINQENVSSGQGVRGSMWSWRKKYSNRECPCGSKNGLDEEADIEEEEEKFIGEMQYGNYSTKEINERKKNIDFISRPTAKSAPIKYRDTDSVMSTSGRSNFTDNSKSSPS